jgi:anion-transporting  ArsA/GET3 family ATPase
VTAPRSPLPELLATKRVVVCCGTGGVGKTTTAAALGLAAARSGRRAAVVTIDPAKRLASALGLDALADEPTVIDPELWDPDATGVSGGSLSALMLDTKSTFDKLVMDHAATPEQGERILANRLYRNVSTVLSGTQEYMAMEKLHQLHSDPGIDVLIVDTPPSRHALDFLDAPNRLVRLFDNRLFRIMMGPTRLSMRAAGAALQAFTKIIARIVGTAVVDDVMAFFRAFEGMEEGFRTRSQEVLRLLESDQSAFVLVTSPRPDAVEEACFFADRLRSTGLEIGALVVNRVHPLLVEVPVEVPLEMPVEAHVEAHVDRPDAVAVWRERATALDLADEPDLADACALVADLAELALAERAAVGPIVERLGGLARVVEVPVLEREVADLDALAAIATHLC